MPAFSNRVTLGRTGLSVCPLAVSGGYGVDDKSLLRAFDRGVNYWYHGSMLRPGMTSAIQQLVAAGKRDELVIVLQSYMRWPWYMERRLAKELRLLGIDHCDVLLLGWYNIIPPKKIVDCVDRMRAKGMFRHVAISSHHRPNFVELAKDPRYGILHIRYTDFIADQVGTVRRYYAFCGRELTDAAESAMRAYLANNRGDRYGKFRYSTQLLVDIGEDLDALHAEFRPFRERFGVAIEHRA